MDPITVAVRYDISQKVIDEEFFFLNGRIEAIINLPETTGRNRKPQVGEWVYTSTGGFTRLLELADCMAGEILVEVDILPNTNDNYRHKTPWFAARVHEMIDDKVLVKSHRPKTNLIDDETYGALETLLSELMPELTDEDHLAIDQRVRDLGISFSKDYKHAQKECDRLIEETKGARAIALNRILRDFIYTFKEELAELVSNDPAFAGLPAPEPEKKPGKQPKTVKVKINNPIAKVGEIVLANGHSASEAELIAAVAEESDNSGAEPVNADEPAEAVIASKDGGNGSSHKESTRVDSGELAGTPMGIGSKS